MNSKSLNKQTNFLYLISSRREFNELRTMEMRYLFKNPVVNNYHITTEEVDISRSTFIKSKVEILYRNKDINIIENDMIQDTLEFENYKIHFEVFDEVPYKERLASMRKLGFTIEGNFAIKDPDVEFILTRIDGEWLFGLLYNNPNKWLSRRDKPYNYSHALDIKIAKAVLNMSIDNDINKTIIDPCCGIGTVLIEGRSAGLDIKGYEINPLVKQQCNKNLVHFGFEPDVQKVNMLESSKMFDCSILDLPYGHSSEITVEEQIALIKKTKDISNRSVIITMTDMSEIYKEIGFTVIDSCRIKKSNVFSRYITICE